MTQAIIDEVLEFHAPFKVYDNCEHEGDVLDDSNHFEIEDVGYTCEEGLLYICCERCCTDNGHVTESCSADHYKFHTTDPNNRCETVRICTKERE